MSETLNAYGLREQHRNLAYAVNQAAILEADRAAYVNFRHLGQILGAKVNGRNLVAVAQDAYDANIKEGERRTGEFHEEADEDYLAYQAYLGTRQRLIDDVNENRGVVSMGPAIDWSQFLKAPIESISRAHHSEAVNLALDGILTPLAPNGGQIFRVDGTTELGDVKIGLDAFRRYPSMNLGSDEMIAKFVARKLGKQHLLRMSADVRSQPIMPRGWPPETIAETLRYIPIGEETAALLDRSSMLDQKKIDISGAYAINNLQPITGVSAFYDLSVVPV